MRDFTVQTITTTTTTINNITESTAAYNSNSVPLTWIVSTVLLVVFLLALVIVAIRLKR